MDGMNDQRLAPCETSVMEGGGGGDRNSEEDAFDELQVRKRAIN